jgi:hypothetical protein
MGSGWQQRVAVAVNEARILDVRRDVSVLVEGSR